MRNKDTLKLIAKGIKPLMSQGNSGYDGQGYAPYKSAAGGMSGYESPTSGKK